MLQRSNCLLASIGFLLTVTACKETEFESHRQVRPGASWGAADTLPGSDLPSPSPTISGFQSDVPQNRQGFDGSGNCYKADAQICEIERLILEQTNAYRAKSGLAPLTAGYRLGYAARDWSQKQAERGRIGHAGFPSARRSFLISEFGPDVPVGLSAENVAMTGYSRSSNEAVATDFTRMWWGSSGHRRNMLGNYRSLGVGVAKIGRSWYATQIFGRE